MSGFPERVTLGRSGLRVGPLAVAGGYGVDERSLLAAFERGVNYWYHGSFVKPGMTSAIQHIVGAGLRDGLVVVLQSYMRWAWYMERTLERELMMLGLDHADVLLLGWYNKGVPPFVMERAMKLRERGLVRHLAVSSHHRPSFVEYAQDTRIDVLHLRYNAAHPGAEQDVFPHLQPEGRPGFVAYTATAWGKLIDPRKTPAGDAPMRARDCYRFALSNPNIQVCMTGPKDAAQLEEALRALDEGPLSPEEQERFRRIGRAVHG